MNPPEPARDVRPWKANETALLGLVGCALYWERALDPDVRTLVRSVVESGDLAGPARSVLPSLLERAARRPFAASDDDLIRLVAVASDADTGRTYDPDDADLPRIWASCWLDRLVIAAGLDPIEVGRLIDVAFREHAEAVSSDAPLLPEVRRDVLRRFRP